MSLKKSLFILVLMLGCNQLFAQDTQYQSKSEQELRGTFQIIVMNSEKEIALTNDVLVEIEKRREENKEVNYQLDENISIKIFSRNFIQSLTFNPDFYPPYVYDNAGKKEQPVVIRKQENVKSK